MGYDTDHEAHAYSELPDEYLSYPGDSVTTLDGEDLSSLVEIFIHAPFKDDCATARNETSLAFQLTLHYVGHEEASAKLLFFGDLAHETLMKIFTYSQDHDRMDRVHWDLLLAPHHCSKRAMFVAVDGDEVKQEDILDFLEGTAQPGTTVVASTGPFPSSDTAGANPPHLKARRCYEAIADDFRCTHEEPTLADPPPVIFALDADGLSLMPAFDPVEVKALTESMVKAAAGVAAVSVLSRVAINWRRSRPSKSAGAVGTDATRHAIRDSRGGDKPPPTAVGFGRR